MKCTYNRYLIIQKEINIFLYISKHFRINTQSIVKTFYILESVSLQTRRRRRIDWRKKCVLFFYLLHNSYGFCICWMMVRVKLIIIKYIQMCVMMWRDAEISISRKHFPKTITYVFVVQKQFLAYSTINHPSSLDSILFKMLMNKTLAYATNNISYNKKF